MSVKQIGAAWELDLPPSVKLTLIALADHADHDGKNARPSVRLLAWKTGQSRRTVQYHLRQLEDRELIEATGYASGGHGRATMYRLTLEKGAKLAPPTEGPKP